VRLTGLTTPATAQVEISFNGRTIRAYEGESVAAALSAQGVLALRSTRGNAERGLWCGMGACFDCVVTIDRRIGERACLVKVRAGMVIDSALPPALADAAPLAPAPNAGGIEERHCDVLVVGAGPGGLAAAVAAGRAARLRVG
jgi:threonine dehydrogenase-like Zn-dependent dehydrogenase